MHLAAQAGGSYSIENPASYIHSNLDSFVVDPNLNPVNPNPATGAVPHRLFNIGNSEPTPLLRFIELLEKALGQEAIKDFKPRQPGDVVATAANTSAFEDWVEFPPNTPLGIGLKRFADWVKEYPEVIGLT